jgi:hypothetical protein
MGLNEFAGYVAVAGAALATGWIAARFGLRPEPFYLGVIFVACGLGLSAFVVRETSPFAARESALRAAAAGAGAAGPAGPSPAGPTSREIFWLTTLRDRNLSGATQAGLVNNLNDGMAWGLFPLAFAAAGLDLERIAALAAIYPATWGVAQIGAGALSDRLGRKWLIAAGMWVQAAGIAVVIVASRFWGFAAGCALLGLGTAMVYPTLLAAVGDVAHPAWRASSVGVYRLWRDLGYAVGALVAGIGADMLGLEGAMWLVAAVTFGSGLVAAFRMTETLGTKTYEPGGRKETRDHEQVRVDPVEESLGIRGRRAVLRARARARRRRQRGDVLPRPERRHVGSPGGEGRRVRPAPRDQGARARGRLLVARAGDLRGRAQIRRQAELDRHRRRSARGRRQGDVALIGRT